MRSYVVSVAASLIALGARAERQIGPDGGERNIRVARDRSASGAYLHAGPKAGVSVNYDQWVAGVFLRAGGLCPFVCLGDLGISIHELGGLGGNHASLRTSLRIDSIFWFGDREKFGIYPALGLSARTLFPAGKFAEFCERTRLEGCGGTFVGVELGVGLRFWPVFVEAIAATGELPSVTATAGLSWTFWEQAS
jgi:hypothetical protein